MVGFGCENARRDAGTAFIKNFSSVYGERLLQCAVKLVGCQHREGVRGVTQPRQSRQIVPRPSRGLCCDWTGPLARCSDGTKEAADGGTT